MDGEKSQIFKEMVVNGGKITSNLLLDTDYAFSFQTVFQSSNCLTYRCCTCAFEHEYFDYIDETGNVNQEMLDKIVDSIRNGACPHADTAPEDCVTETEVTGLHVVAATGSEEQLVWYLNNISHNTSILSGVFKLQPYLVTLLKNKRLVRNTSYNILRQCQLQQLLPAGFKTNTKLLYAQRSPENYGTIIIKRMSISDVCVQKRSTSMLKFLFKTTENQSTKGVTFTYFNNKVKFKPGFPAQKLGIACVYETAYRQGLVQGKDFIPVIHELFVRKLPTIQCKHQIYYDEFETELEKFIETIIVCDLPEVLDCLFKETGLEMKCRCSILAQSGTKECCFCSLNKTCLVLRRTECKRIIERHHKMDLPNSETKSIEQSQNKALKQTKEIIVQEAEESLDIETIRNEAGREEGEFICKDYADTKMDVVYNVPSIEKQTDSQMSVEATIKKLVSLLENHPYSKDEIKAALQTIPNLSHAIKAPLRKIVDKIYSKMPFAMCRIRRRPNRQPFSSTGQQGENKQTLTADIDIIRIFIEAGADIDNEKSHQTTMLQGFLNRKLSHWPHPEIEYRQILELFLYANPSVVENWDIVGKGLKVDLNTVNYTQTQQSRPNFPYLGHLGHYQRPTHQYSTTTGSDGITPWTYTMDAKEHFFFNDNPSTACFNFTAPLLIECGFPIRHRTLEKALNDPHHPEVKGYLRQCLDVPRPLMHCCRDVLRKHWKGRRIHEFVNRTHIPRYIQDFILLKTVLHTV